MAIARNPPEAGEAPVDDVIYDCNLTDPQWWCRDGQALEVRISGVTECLDAGGGGWTDKVHGMTGARQGVPGGCGCPVSGPYTPVRAGTRP
ncbi:hypothetical protein ACFC1R_06170 [Kitasatospora sp. NPDC056138]|uniref:hypothetical protein n=1 Tax=Kitasatospora sp. NPDC056138 TaxID=3345724 RepID=UPI0035E1321F